MFNTYDKLLKQKYILEPLFYTFLHFYCYEMYASDQLAKATNGEEDTCCFKASQAVKQQRVLIVNLSIANSLKGF